MARKRAEKARVGTKHQAAIVINRDDVVRNYLEHRIANLERIAQKYRKYKAKKRKQLTHREYKIKKPQTGNIHICRI